MLHHIVELSFVFVRRCDTSSKIVENSFTVKFCEKYDYRDIIAVSMIYIYCHVFFSAVHSGPEAILIKYITRLEFPADVGHQCRISSTDTYIHFCCYCPQTWLPAAVYSAIGVMSGKQTGSKQTPGVSQTYLEENTKAGSYFPPGGSVVVNIKPRSCSSSKANFPERFHFHFYNQIN